MSTETEVRTEQNPAFFTQHMAQLRVIGLAISDPKRLLILALLAEEDRPMYGQEIAEHLGVTPQTISHHLQIMKNGGLVREQRENAYRYYSLDKANIQHIRETFFADNSLGLPTKREIGHKVIESFFQDGHLLRIPKHNTKRHVVLLELAKAFEWGHIYTEAEVNTILKHAYEDTASLRRYMIDEQIMLREHGRYWLVRPNHSEETKK